MNDTVKNDIKKILTEVIEKKMQDYAQETDYKPFFNALFSSRDVAVGSVIQSLYTSFGMSVYEQIAVTLAKSAGYQAERQYTLIGKIDTETENWISNHWNELRTNLKNKEDIALPSKASEIETIKNMVKTYSPTKDEITTIKNKKKKDKDGDSTVDLYIRKPDGSEYYIDITTVKNNLKSFEVLKLKLLRWIALRASVNKNINIATYIAIPYNPYHPENYLSSRWNSTILDSNNDILVQEEFWNFVGNDKNTYNDLLCICEEVGKELKPKIETFFNLIK